MVEKYLTISFFFLKTVKNAILKIIVRDKGENYVNIRTKTTNH